jgi:hypothetical protein
VAKIGNNWQQLTDFQTSFGLFHVFQLVEHIPDSLRTITTKNETFQKNQQIPFLVNVYLIAQFSRQIVVQILGMARRHQKFVGISQYVHFSIRLAGKYCKDFQSCFYF